VTDRNAHRSPALAARARAVHRDALAALADAGRRVPSDVVAALRGCSEEVPVACTFSEPGRPMLAAPDTDLLATSYRVIFERWFGRREDLGTRMVEVSYDACTNTWRVTLNAFFAQPDPLGAHSRNGSAQGSHLDKRSPWTSPVLPVPPGHLREAV
jgi:hypothetical protein